MYTMPLKKSQKKSNNNSSKNYKVYTLNLEGGHKYVGMTGNYDRRMNEHFSGNGAKWTQKHQPTGYVQVSEYKTKNEARKAETDIYYKVKKSAGDKVRGAGYTKSY